ncbi:hypothetical protein [Alienimonas sp. DA493]|uniref:hypothetical protein n=1 Tax=Alienimonas sp. DA493 TaxID=3373605 RepID=UPI003754C27A
MSSCLPFSVRTICGFALALSVAGFPMVFAGCDSGPEGMGDGMPSKEEIIEANKALDGEGEGYRD